MSGSPAGDAWQAELDRLRAENAALNEQVKLLVLTEQRLYRSQNELDAQLVLVRALALFALESSMLEEPGSTLSRALDLLGDNFPIDWAGFVHPSVETGEVVVSAALGEAAGSHLPREVADDVDAWLRSGPAALWSPNATDSTLPCWRLLDVVAPGLVPADDRARLANLACVPLRGTGAFAPGVLVTVSLHPRPAFLRGGALAERHLPYLSLLANHVDHALSNTHLTRRLRERSAELVHSVERLESTQQELLQAQKMEAIGRLAGGVAHDFNNLLTVILGYAGTLAASLSSGSPAHENMSKITAAAQRAANLTRQLLALGRRQVQRREHFSLSEESERTVDLLRRLVGEDIRIDLRLDRAVGAVHADRAQLEQVLLNLIVNARDAMPKGGVLRVSTRSATGVDAERCNVDVDPAHYVVLEVSDDGTGMDALTRQRIFEPFFTTKPSGQGTGLGLAVVYGIVKQSEGHILVESEPGRGTTFTVLLPTEAGPVAPEPPSGPIAEDTGALYAGQTVLVVEDEAAIREVVRATLRRAGYVVLEAMDGEDALVRIGARLPDLVLSDILMPRMGGPALARELAARHPGVRVAFMSGYAADFGDESGGIEHTSAFLPKPFTGEELRTFVARQLAGTPSTAGAAGA